MKRKNMASYSGDNWEEEGMGPDAHIAGPWHAPLTFVTLLTVALASLIMAFATKGIDSRPAWLLALTFAVPSAVLMITVFLIEKATGAMTPSVSRRYQAGLAAAVVVMSGCIGYFGQVTNVEAKQVGKAWSDVIIILDKSSSMKEQYNGQAKDEMAMQAVHSLLEQMGDEVQVGLVIDRGSTEYGSTSVAIGSLTQAHRDELLQEVNKTAYGNTYFDVAIQGALSMIPAGYETGELAIIMVTDGNCPITTSLFQNRLTNGGISFHYIRIGAEENEDLTAMAVATGGMSLDVANESELFDSMKEITSREVTTYDALRDIGLSSQAQTVVGILMLALGILLGISLTVMFSVQGQKRFQLILSPLMAVLSFGVLAFSSPYIASPVIRETIAFSLLGIVVMRKNRSGGSHQNTTVISPAEDTDW